MYFARSRCTSAAVRKTVQETTHAVGEMSPAEKKATAWLAAIGVLIGVSLLVIEAIGGDGAAPFIYFTRKVWLR